MDSEEGGLGLLQSRLLGCKVGEKDRRFVEWCRGRGSVENVPSPLARPHYGNRSGNGHGDGGRLRACDSMKSTLFAGPKTWSG
ncbi:unnamed protein product [Allacma fusca]|uniref:Uncharacterized protein n=1 Tax=Allacma fusca TaxID=39272 RepID=A0A8J2K050_9HEXA|nr:unnamed protein product [Allacma fusca]